MSMQLTDAKKKLLAALIKTHHEQHLSRFPFAKYPVEPLEVWKKQFTDPATIEVHTLRAALSWSCGKWQQQSISYPYKKLHLIVISNWKNFVEQYKPEPSLVISYWMELLGKGEYVYNTVTFLAHLLCAEQVELADSRRVKGMNDLLKEAELPDECAELEDVVASVEQYSEFYRQVLPKTQSTLGDQASLKLSRFLFAYGYRDVLGKVAERTSNNLEPIVTALDWETIDSKRFNLDLISERANADILFACLLLALETMPNIPDKFIIQDILNLIPLGTAGICNPASYNYALISMFGNQKGRDYFVFEDESISKSFTEQANSSTRDMHFYLRFSNSKIHINDRYLNI
ncbi:hypothetical protein G9G63_14635 [Paenibacillus sp. EKM202P]|uniref:hypothetical protein n=1 Tax=unclassified Paenibacillus TaxID=185978 RepID=UPI0013ED243D|nr:MULTISPECIES: hypothetical protein [unclassified Paenibacillus]KAF6563424.1 hypothetical protein G9G63_14635 [Paenibacillus sp. EKM202P]KAF6569980.1 hypothetical protein G9G64_10240 [Paenibacillus sp. EKM207P]